MTYFYLHIFGTDHHDCKFLFSDKEKLLSYLQRLPLVKHIYERRYLCPSEDQIYRYEQVTVVGDEALKWWESKIHVLQIDEKTLPKYHKMFPAPFWDELPEKYRERVFR